MSESTSLVHVAAPSGLKYSDEERRLILETCCGGASEAEAFALIGIAEARGMNVLAQECYFVRRYDRAKSKEVWAVQAAIDSFRIRAERTGLYDGQDEPEYEYSDKGHIILARVRVYRKDWSRPMVGIARWSEYVQTTRDGKPTRFWETMPHNQLAKCAEALALRKAFPSALAKIYTAEEMGQADNVPRHPEPLRGPIKPPPPLPPADLTKQLAASIDERSEVDKVRHSLMTAETLGELNERWLAFNEIKKGWDTRDVTALTSAKNERKMQLQNATRESAAE